MSDETKTEAQTSEPKEGKVTFESQADFDAVIQRRLAKEREKYSDYDQTKDELEKLRQKQKEREEAELTELEKYQSRVNELTGQVEELSQYKEKLTSYEQAETERYNKIMDDAEFTDAQKERVNKLPLPDRIEMINDLKAANRTEPPATAGKGQPFHRDKKLEEILAMPDGPAKRKAYGEYRQAVGRA